MSSHFLRFNSQLLFFLWWHCLGISISYLWRYQLWLKIIGKQLSSVLNMYGFFFSVHRRQYSITIISISILLVLLEYCEGHALLHASIMAFYIRDESSHWFWYLQVVLEPISYVDWERTVCMDNNIFPRAGILSYFIQQSCEPCAWRGMLLVSIYWWGKWNSEMSVSQMQDLFQWSLFSTELFFKVAPSASLGMNSEGTPLAGRSALPALPCLSR